MGKGNLNESKNRGKLVPVEEWDNFISKEDVFLVDVRNNFEIDIGSFQGSINPNTSSFREFGNKFDNLKVEKNTIIAMYCTGGIRCEKASSYLKLSGYKNVYQLDGGILKYLDYKMKGNKRSLWSGECFVFDNRVTINRKLQKGKYLQCCGCRRPITTRDTESIYYKKGVTCPLCFHERSSEQKKRSLTRQVQIERAEEKKEEHPFKKIK